MSSLRRISPALLLLLLASPAVVVAACGDDAAPADGGTGSGSGGGSDDDDDASAAPVAVSAGSTSTVTGAGSTGSGSPTSTQQSAQSSGSGDGGSGPGQGGAGQGGDPGPGQGGSGQGGDPGAGGQGGGVIPCEPSDFDAPSTIQNVWDVDPADPTPFYLPDVIVTAISLGGCVADAFCQLFVQQDEVYASFDDGAQQAIRVVVAPELAGQFVQVAVGDRVDLGGSAQRDTTGDRDELRFFIRESDPGCMEVVGSAAPLPTPVDLGELTQNAYETTHGPLLVGLTLVSGRPHQPGEIFALWETGGPQGGGIEQVTNASPFFIPGGEFVGFTPEEIVDFASVSGVFGQFIPSGDTTKYETIYARTQGDLVALP